MHGQRLLCEHGCQAHHVTSCRGAARGPTACHIAARDVQVAVPAHIATASAVVLQQEGHICVVSKALRLDV